MKVCLIRHGETDWTKARRLQGREDIPLNDEGIVQARAAGAFLARESWDRVIASPLSRALQTAEIIAQALHIHTVETDACFMERDYGLASGLSPEQRKQSFPDGQFEGMEALDVLRDRVYGGLLKQVRKHDGSNLIIVSHGAAINAILSVVSDGAVGTGKTRLQTACLSLLRYEDENFYVEYCNRTAE